MPPAPVELTTRSVLPAKNSSGDWACAAVVMVIAAAAAKVNNRLEIIEFPPIADRLAVLDTSETPLQGISMQADSTGRVSP
ncbi:hypothetical protein GCM10011358_27650 [Sinisalibacter lacisalsi]|uniref:Uncharacterized protein n=1 Tax=Sinisalibacter lacisalsi TaxID=1526570 RepID=A0ABQ1QRC1_9RHOB|nr:hypothetical protein GCM10011358_27650 [Sinisalibacter lacisalsi]